MKASKIVNKRSQIHGNIETYNDIVFENCVVGDVDRFVVSYREESSPVIFRNCVFNDNVMVVIETGNKTYIEVNDLEMDKGSVLIIKPNASCIIDGMRMGPFSSFQSSDGVKSKVLKDVYIKEGVRLNKCKFEANLEVKPFVELIKTKIINKGGMCGGVEPNKLKNLQNYTLDSTNMFNQEITD